MEFLSKFRHDSDGKQEAHETTSTSAQPAITTPAPPTEPIEPERDLLTKLIAGSGHTNHSNHRPSSSTTTTTNTAAATSPENPQRHHNSPHTSSLFTTKKDREARALELVKREAELRYKLDLLAKEKTDNEGFFATLRARFDSEAERDKHEAHAAGTPGEFWDRFTGREEMERKRVELEGREAELRGQLVVVERERRENEGLVERLKGCFDGGDERKGNGEEEDKGKGKGEDLAKEEEEGGKKGHDSEISGLLDKITGKAAEEERLRREEESKSSLERIKDRINESMGGGKKAEEKEDLLDKAIDEFQEHVLHKGDQSNESALEQIKDERVAEIIRNRLHFGQKKGD